MASVYYIGNGGGYEVVVTLAASHGEGRVPIRLTTELKPGESKTVEPVSFAMLEGPVVLEIERADEELSGTVMPYATALSAPAPE